MNIKRIKNTNKYFYNFIWNIFWRMYQYLFIYFLRIAFQEKRLK